MTQKQPTTFLTAAWRNLIMANYEVAPSLLQPYVPPGTELDIWNGRCYVSLVGFLFTDTRVRGVAIPFHTTFEEVNLRFYVRYRSSGGWRRGVVFVREIVPRRMIALVANTLYRENYRALPMSHRWHETSEQLEVSYSWQLDGEHTLGVTAERERIPIAAGSEEEFITEHYWGYARWDEKTTNEYEVVHPRWNVHPIIDHTLSIDCGRVYGAEWEGLTESEPTSVFLADGSDVEVRSGERIVM